MLNLGNQRVDISGNLKCLEKTWMCLPIQAAFLASLLVRLRREKGRERRERERKRERNREKEILLLM